jgi:hypothetical protein
MIYPHLIYDDGLAYIDIEQQLGAGSFFISQNVSIGDQMARLSAAAGSPESNRVLRLARDIVTRGIILCRLLKLETIYGLENNLFN